jgi:hypothetical protein
MNDNGNYGAGGAKQTMLPIPITVTPVNQAPRVSVLSSSISTNEDTSTTMTYTITEIDDGVIGMTASITCLYCASLSATSSDYTSTSGTTLTLGSWISGTSPYTLVVSYTPTSNWNSNAYGTDMVTAIFTDIHGASSTPTTVVTIDVISVNDAPILTIPVTATQTINEMTSVTITGITVTDNDADDTYGSVIQTTITVTSTPGPSAVGVITLATRAGLTFILR